MKKRVTGFAAIIVLINCVAFFTSIAASSNTGPDVSVGVRFDNVNVRVGTPGERAMEILLKAPADTGSIDGHASAPMNIALVIDRSGSMDGEGKMGFVKEAARSIVERLRACDRIALIGYDDRAEVIIPMQLAREKNYLIDKIYSLFPRGSTNLGDGLLAGYREIDGRRGRNEVNRVILLSDGLANRGVTSLSKLSRITSGNYEEGISLSTLGVGAGFNEDLMTTLAMDGGGMYYYIDRPSRIPEIMAREFSALQTLVASKIILRVELAANIGINKIIGNRYEERGRTIEYNVGELSVGERRRYMIHLDIPELSEGKHAIGRVSLQYEMPGREKHRAFTEPVYLNAMADERQIVQGKNDEVIERTYIFEVNDARRRAVQAVDRGNMTEAVTVLAEVEKRLERAPIRTERLAKEKMSIQRYDADIKRNPHGSRLRQVQKGIKHRVYALEGC